MIEQVFKIDFAVAHIGIQGYEILVFCCEVGSSADHLK